MSSCSASWLPRLGNCGHEICTPELKRWSSVCHYRGLEWDGDSSWLLCRSCGKVNGKVQSCYRGNWERSAPFYARTSCLPEWAGNCCPPEGLNSLCIQKSNNWVLSGKKELWGLLVLHSDHDWLGFSCIFFCLVLSFSFMLSMWWCESRKEVVLLQDLLTILWMQHLNRRHISVRCNNRVCC